MRRVGNWRAYLGLALTVVLATGTPPLAAHPSPEQAIAALTLVLETSGPSAPLLVKRAQEYREAGQPRAALNDLRQALVLTPNDSAILLAISQLHRQLGDLAEALRLSELASRAAGPTPHAPLLAWQAELLAATGAHRAALAHWEQALTPGPGEVDWILLRASSQRALGQHQEAAAGLHAAYQQTQAAVLHGQWLEALLDCQTPATARLVLAEAAPWLAKARWRATWLLRVGRAHQQVGQVAEAQAAWNEALGELNERIHPQRPDPGLLQDRALCHRLLGDSARAQADLTLARQHGAPETQLAP